jgi:RNA 2',3'-cyclic 3'-phosphodiesterase
MAEGHAMAKRMFVAVDLPEALSAKLAGMDPRVPGLRWLPAAQLHLTLCFLGLVPEENEGCLIRELGRIDVMDYQIVLKGMGSFGRRGAPSVLWAGVIEESGELQRLRKRVRAAAIAAGLVEEGKRFRPHVTVGRCKNVDSGWVDRFLADCHNLEIGAFTTSGFMLYESVLRPEGAEHRVVRRFPDGKHM